MASRSGSAEPILALLLRLPWHTRAVIGCLKVIASPRFETLEMTAKLECKIDFYQQ
jgi:hypothetical protein